MFTFKIAFNLFNKSESIELKKPKFIRNLGVAID